MKRRQTRAHSGVVESAQLVIPQREVSVAPFHIRAGALEHLREYFGLVLEPVLFHHAQLAQGPTGRKEWGAEALSKRTQRLTFGDRPRRGHTLEIEGWDEMGVPRVGRGRRHVQLLHLLPHIPRDGWCFKCVDRLVEWPICHGPQRRTL